MARYYLHCGHTDDEGTELPSIEAAREEAVLTARELLANAIKAGTDVPKALVIADETGQTLETVSLASFIPETLRS